eukprot:1050296-Rhodomonas_salina.1
MLAAAIAAVMRPSTRRTRASDRCSTAAVIDPSSFSTPSSASVATCPTHDADEVTSGMRLGDVQYATTRSRREGGVVASCVRLLGHVR